SEDCLQMNIWMPDKNVNHQTNMSTIVFLYGGSFATGSGSIDFYNGSMLALRQNVIVITLNYRVGPLGFAYFGEDSEVKGNMGLLDQQVGLQWIYDNIEYFGGNKSNITLFGSSAGAASVTAHLLSDNSHKYFDKIIADSGAITNVWAIVPQSVALNNSLWLARLAGCHNETNIHKINKTMKENIIKCMQSENVNTTFLNDMQFTTRDKHQPPFPYTFLPIYNDTVFFNGSIFEKLRNGDVKKNVTSMYGRTSEEGSYFMPFMLGYEYGCGYNYSFNATDPQNQCLNITGATVFLAWFKLGDFYNLSYTEDAELGLAYLLNAENKCETSNDTFTATNLYASLVAQKMKNSLNIFSSKDTKNNSPLDDTTMKKLNNCSLSRNREKMISEIGDFLFNCDNINFANKSSINDTNSETYVFEFRKRSTVNPWPQWMGAMHGYELEYVFGLPFRNTSIYNQSILIEEQKYADKIMEIFGNFSKYGHFNSTWEPYKKRGYTTLNNTYCAILDKNLTNDNYQLQYTDVLTSKCKLMNSFVDKHYPRCKPKTKTQSSGWTWFSFIGSGSSDECEK
uniref:Carboxylic ester hydrolase n=1 Tax=Parastrongyloides trichosuri TaxID=131310 RepID=A0A0N4ZEB2_PARTI